ncbi:MAG: acyltransferase [Rhodospirillales bacterium]|jgi:exopolysaccharide production protein ExoZ|nr:acyltransferase [Rhodospirillales bacterium]
MPIADTVRPRGTGPTTSGSLTSGQIRSVQLLRAIAALFVVAFHSTVLWRDKAGPDVIPWQNGNSGVDLFFVISGFIMVLSSQRLLDRPDGWRRFLVLRIVRITPMYWLVTAAKLVAILAVPAGALHTRVGGWNVLASFLFIPSHDPAGFVRPVIIVGYTLSFEFLFYAAFAAALFFALDPLVVVAPTMAVLAILSIARAADWPAISMLADPIVLEFVLGVVLGYVFLDARLQRLSPWWVLPISFGGLLCLAFLPADGRWERVVVWGLAAMATLGAGAIADRWVGRYLPDRLVEIGEASYSMYLTHGFVLPVIGVIVARTKLTGDAFGVALVGLCLIVSTVAAVATYRHVEVPMTTWLRRRVGDRRRTSLPASKTPI